MNASEWLSTNDLAEWLQVPPATVSRWRYQDTGPVGYRVGRHIRYRRDDIETWLQQRREIAS
ncbi:MAG: helix-turn-helix domain-containing protein [Gemmatimonadales bacterium]|jgi:excisionase family DNA binding protein|nr:helix-turn-helix domain-containing protein [Gemmatimonadales bacterium]MBT7692605.1 helix-turn-helix domain-containing protein [Gemmatimonadales bacterium]